MQDRSIYRPSDSDVSRFDNLKNIAYSGIFAVAAVAMSFNNFIGMWTVPATRREAFVYAAQVILFVEFVVLIFRWVIATHHEFELWLRWLDNPIQKQEVYGALFGLSVFLGICVAFPHRIVFVTAFMSSAVLFSYWTQWLANDHFRRALERTRQTANLNESQRRVLAVLERYWLKRPQLARATTIMFFALIAFALALAGAVQNEPAQTRWQLCAYAVLIADIFIGEIFIAWWRYTRDRDVAIALAEE